MPPREPHHHKGRHAPDFDDGAYTPSTIQPDAAAADGTALAPARADHTHAIVAAAPSTTLGGTSSNSEGAATSFARSDHAHDVGTAAPGLTLSTTNSEGTSNNLLRVDATIAAFDATVPTTIQPDDAAAAGSAGVAARRDHRHAIAAAAPSTIGTANSEGVSTSFARADHIHAQPSTTDTVARVGVRKNSTGSTFERRRVNLIEGSGVTLTVADDSANEEVDVTIASSAASAVNYARGCLLMGG